MREVPPPEPLPFERRQEAREARRRIEELERLEAELRDEVAALRKLALALVALVPPERLIEIRTEAPSPEGAGSNEEMFTGWVESTALTPSDVATELKLLWKRCPRR